MEVITNYVIGVLLILTISLGFTTYIYHADKTRLQDEVTSVTGKLRQSEANVTLATKSCEATQAITKDVSTSIDTQQTVMTKTLEALATVPTTEEDNTNDPKKYADDARLSPSLMGLLNTTYCSANKADASCTVKPAANLPR